MSLADDVHALDRLAALSRLVQGLVDIAKEHNKILDQMVAEMSKMCDRLDAVS